MYLLIAIMIKNTLLPFKFYEKGYKGILELSGYDQI